MNNQIT